MTDSSRAKVEREAISLQTELDRIRQLFDLAPQYFYAHDVEGRFVFVNEALAKLFGKPREDLIGKMVYQSLPVPRDTPPDLTNLRNVMESGQPIFYPEFKLIDTEGVSRTIELHEIPYRDPATGELRTLGIGHDITDRLQFEAQRRKHERLQRDLEIARMIQEALLPRGAPDAGEIEIAGWSRPADQTGGDHYDWLPLADGRIVVTIADVTGHGVGPAIVTAVCRAYARATLTSAKPLDVLMARLNEHLLADLPMDRFITFAAAVVDPAAARIELCSAGQGPIFLYRDASKSVEVSNADDPPLAVVPGLKFSAPRKIELASGDALLLVSDGFWEWSNDRKEQYGSDRLCESIVSSSDRPAPDMIAALLGDVQQFAGSADQPDDMTAVVIRRKPSG